MSEDNQNKNEESLVDLSELSNLQFQTAWTPAQNGSKYEGTPRQKPFGGARGKKPFRKRESGEDFGGSRRPKTDRRFQPRNASDEANAKPRKNFNKKFRKDGDKKRQFVPFNFTMDVQIFPEDAPFNKLAEIIKASKRTYQLFDVARLILDKRERMVILAKNLPDSDNIVKPLFWAQPLNIPFEDEQSAKNAALDFYFEAMFAPEQVEAEPPKGAFTVVNKCTLTGDILGAPNWHMYGKTVREYHKARFPKMPFEDFAKTIESVKGEENINAWLEQMKTRTVYKLKEVPEGEEAQTFDSADAAKAYIAEKKSDELVKVYEQVRMNAANIDKMPFGRIRRNFEEAIRKEKRFPIATANNMRGKLRRCGFAVYKRGSKGFAFVSVIKRKFLYEGETLADAPQKIFDFVLANPAIKISEVPYKVLGIDAPQPAQEPQKPIDETEPQPAALQPDEALSDEQKEQFKSVYSELAWLISEGYVVEYSDTSLQANPYLPKPKDKSAEVKSEDAAVANDEPVAPQPAEQTEEGEAAVEAESGAGEKAGEAVETSAVEEAGEAVVAESADDAKAEDVSAAESGAGNASEGGANEATAQQ